MTQTNAITLRFEEGIDQNRIDNALAIVNAFDDSTRQAVLWELAPAWAPKVDSDSPLVIQGIVQAVLVGEMEDTFSRVGGEILYYPKIILLSPEQGMVAVHAFSRVARSHCERIRVAEGMRIVAVYRGERQSKDGNNTYADIKIMEIGGSRINTWNWSESRRDETVQPRQRRVLEDTGPIPF